MDFERSTWDHAMSVFSDWQNFADHEVHAVVRSDVSLSKRQGSGEFSSDGSFAAQQVIQVISASDRCCFFDAVAYLSLPPRPEMVEVEMPTNSRGVTFNVFGADFEIEVG